MKYKFIIFIVYLYFLYADSVTFNRELYLDGQNARNIGMGGYSISFSPGGNPAKLKINKNSSVNLSYKDKFSGLASINSISYLYTQFVAGKSYPISISLINRTVPEIPDTRFAKNANGSINYSRISYFSQKEIGFAIASKFNFNGVSFGFTIEPSYISLLEYQGWGISGDIGVLKSLFNEKMEIGCRIDNLISFNSWNTGLIESSIPILLADSQIRFKSFLIGFEVGSKMQNNSQLIYHFGAEFSERNQIIFFRGGMSSIDQLSMGIGLNFDVLDIDYALIQSINDSPFKSSYILGLDIDVKKFIKLKNKLSP